MHIVLVTAFLSETPWDVPGGGMGEYVTKIARLLTQRGNTVEIVSGAQNDMVWECQGITVYNAFWYGNLFGNSIQVSEAIIRRNIAIQRKLREINKKHRIDVVQYAGWSGIGMFHSLNCPSILRLSTYSKITYANNPLFKHCVHIYSFFERMAGRMSDRIICPGIILADAFSKDIKKKVTIVETPVVAETDDLDDSVYETIANHNYLLFFGTASYEKGFETIGDMCKTLFEQHQSIMLVFAGWDEGRGNQSAVRRLKSKLGKNAERFIYLGPLDKRRLYPVIKGAKAVLVPSLADNFPNTCLEAMSLGKIVIGTQGTSLAQVIKDGENGFLAKPGDVDSLYNAVERMLQLEDEQVIQMTKRIKKSLKPYTAQNVINKMMMIYISEIKRKRIR